MNKYMNKCMNKCMNNIDIYTCIFRIKSFIDKLYSSERIELKNNNILLILPINIYIQCLKNNISSSSSSSSSSTIQPPNTINTNYSIIIFNDIIGNDIIGNDIISNDNEYIYEPIYYSNIEKRELINFDFIKKVIDCCDNFYKVKKLLQTHELTKSIYFKFNQSTICLKILLANNTGSLIYNLIHVENYNNHEAYYSNSYEHKVYELFDNYNWYKVDVNKFNEFDIKKVLIR